MSEPRTEFYILSLRWTREDVLTWWGPNNSGYTNTLEDAGRYSRERVEAARDYYDNGQTTIAIPCADVEARAARVVTGRHLEDLTRKRFEWALDTDDHPVEECASCGVTPASTRLGLRVVGEVKP